MPEQYVYLRTDLPQPRTERLDRRIAALDAAARLAAGVAIAGKPVHPDAVIEIAGEFERWLSR